MMMTMTLISIWMTFFLIDELLAAQKS